MTRRMVKVLVLPVGGGPPRTTMIDGDDYRALRDLVDGNLGSCSLPPTLRNQGFYAFCDDDALIREPVPAANRFAAHLGHFNLHGPVVIVRTDEMGETQGLRHEDVNELTVYFAEEPTDEARRAAHNEERFWQDHPTGMAIWTPDQGWENL
jgi:hypothetical protein